MAIAEERPSGFADINWLDLAATITATREVGTLPATNLKTPRVSNRFRVADLSAGDVTTRVEIDFGAARPLRRIFWQRPRRPQDIENAAPASFIATDTVRHFLSSSDAHDGDVYDSGEIASGIVNGYGVHDHLVPLDGLGAVRSAQFAAFEFNALSRTDFPDNYVDWGRAWYADQWEFGIGFGSPFSVAWVDASTATRSFDGSGETVNIAVGAWRELTANFNSIRMAERQDVLDFLNRTGRRKRFLFLEDASVADPRRALIARNTTPQIDRLSRAFNRFQLQLVESL